MNENEYQTICDYVQKRSGIMLGDSKSYLVESRLNPVAQRFGYDDVGALARALGTPAAAEASDVVVDAMTTNESFFFRDNTPFELFEKVILPELLANKAVGARIRIWCAAASTGQEPYSLAMQLLANKALLAGREVEIIGTDISESALEKAKQGEYTQFEVQRGLPVQLLVEHFTQKGTNWVISEEVRKMVRFKLHNLLDAPTSIGKVDLVFCRNVLIYFDVETKTKVLEAIYGAMHRDGFLVLGAAETMIGVTDLFERSEGRRGLYQPMGEVAQGAALTA
jgi:chemotaxis protein methyltransferase CheR